MSGTAPVLVALAAAIAGGLLGYVTIAQVVDVLGGTRQRRVLSLTSDSARAPRRRAAPGFLGLIEAALEAIGQRLGRRVLLVSERALVEAGFEGAWIRPRSVAALKVVLGVVVGLSLATLTPWVPAMVVGAPVGGLLGFVAPSLYIDARKASRRARVLAQVPDFIAELRALISSGIGLERALHLLVADRADAAEAGELGTEIKRALSSYGVGVPVTMALQGASDRLGSAEFESLVLALKQAHRLGSELDAVLGQHESAFRAHRQSRIDGEVAKQEAKAQLIIAVCFLPAFMLLILIPMLMSIMQELFA